MCTLLQVLQFHHYLLPKRKKPGMLVQAWNPSTFYHGDSSHLRITLFWSWQVSLPFPMTFLSCQWLCFQGYLEDSLMWLPQSSIRPSFFFLRTSALFILMSELLWVIWKGPSHIYTSLSLNFSSPLKNVCSRIFV